MIQAKAIMQGIDILDYPNAILIQFTKKLKRNNFKRAVKNTLALAR